MGHDTLMLEELPDSKNVILITHGNARIHVIRVQNDAHSFGRMGGI